MKAFHHLRHLKSIVVIQMYISTPMLQNSERDGRVHEMVFASLQKTSRKRS